MITDTTTGIVSDIVSAINTYLIGIYNGKTNIQIK